MTTKDSPFHPDLRPVVRRLLDEPLLDLSDDPVAMQLLKTHRSDVQRWFHDELGWQFELDARERVARLYKRRDDPPGDRGPWLVRRSGRGRQAPAAVLSLLCVVLSQMWRTRRMRLTALERTVAQTCAAADGALPKFVAVPDADEVSAAQAHRSRHALVDALRLGVQMGVLTSDMDLQVAADDHSADGTVSARHDRLRLLLASPSPTLLALDDVALDQHAALLAATTAADVLSDARPALDGSQPTDVRDRRQAAVRQLLDDPAVDPTEHGGYLTNPAARDRAVRAVQAAGLVVCARSDWWQTTDPAAPHSTFPSGRSWARQAALVVLHAVTSEPDEHWDRDRVIAVLDDLSDRVDGWPGKADVTDVADDAIDDLCAAALLRRVEHGSLQPTPGIHLWDIAVSLPDPEDTSEDLDNTTPTATQQPAFDVTEYQ